MTNNNKRELYITKGGDCITIKRKINVNINGTGYLITLTNDKVTAIIVHDEITGKWVKLPTVSIKKVFGVKTREFIKQLDEMDTYCNYTAEELLHEGLDEEFSEYVEENIHVIRGEHITYAKNYLKGVYEVERLGGI